MFIVKPTTADAMPDASLGLAKNLSSSNAKPLLFGLLERKHKKTPGFPGARFIGQH